MALIVVLDFGKTNSKASLWTSNGQLVAYNTRMNNPKNASGALCLDELGIKLWLVEILTDFGKKGPIKSIIPIGHGAAAAIVRDGKLLCAPVDYETPLAPEIQAHYNLERDPFNETGSPSLPLGLNLGAQLFKLEAHSPGILADAHILLWPQYWAWILSGVMASEVTSLGCHTDLWQPFSASLSHMAIRRSWGEKLPPVRDAGDVLGTLNADWASHCGITGDVHVFCGLHDSNAALVAARLFDDFVQSEATLVSTGTWFVAMRDLSSASDFDIGSLGDGRDCLINVDVNAQPVPSARFMGGREIEQLLGVTLLPIENPEDQATLEAIAPDVVGANCMVLPSFAPGTGPFPGCTGSWINQPSNKSHRRVAIALYAALMCDVCLDLIGAKAALLIEGRFAKSVVFVRALASLRPEMRVYVLQQDLDAAFGALSLVEPLLRPETKARRVFGFDWDLGGYRAHWRTLFNRVEDIK